MIIDAGIKSVDVNMRSNPAVIMIKNIPLFLILMRFGISLDDARMSAGARKKSVLRKRICNTVAFGLTRLRNCVPEMRPPNVGMMPNPKLPSVEYATANIIKNQDIST